MKKGKVSKKRRARKHSKQRREKKVWERTLRGRLKRRLGRSRVAIGSTEEKVYNFVCKNPGMCTYDMGKRLKMSGGRVRHALQQLNDRGLVKFKFVRTEPRIKKLSYPVEAWNLVPRGLRDAVKKVAHKRTKKR